MAAIVLRRHGWRILNRTGQKILREKLKLESRSEDVDISQLLANISVSLIHCLKVSLVSKNEQTVTVTLPLSHDVYDLVSQAAASEQRSLEDLLSRLVIEGLDARATTREVLERVSAQYRARTSSEGKSQQSSERVLAGAARTSGADSA